MATREAGSTLLVTRPIKVADCVRLPDCRIGRVRGVAAEGIRIRVRRRTSKTHQFLVVRATHLQRVDCPKGETTGVCAVSADHPRQAAQAVEPSVDT